MKKSRKECQKHSRKFYFKTSELLLTSFSLMFLWSYPRREFVVISVEFAVYCSWLHITQITQIRTDEIKEEIFNYHNHLSFPNHSSSSTLTSPSTFAKPPLRHDFFDYFLIVLWIYLNNFHSISLTSFSCRKIISDVNIQKKKLGRKSFRRNVFII